jgi:hypothetical protein
MAVFAAAYALIATEKVRRVAVALAGAVLMLLILQAPDQLLAVHPVRADRHRRHRRPGRALPVAAVLRIHLTRPCLPGELAAFT